MNWIMPISSVLIRKHLFIVAMLNFKASKYMKNYFT